MKHSHIPGPVLCMQRDKDALIFVKNNIITGECCCVTGMNGMGKDIIYTALLKDLPSVHKDYAIKFLNAVTQEELKEFITELQKNEEPTIAIINTRLGQDIAWFVDELSRLRIKRGSKFISVVISYSKDIYSSLIGGNKLLSSNLYILQPIGFDDTMILLKDFEKRYSFILSSQQKKLLFDISSGHVGLLKSLFLLLKSNPDYVFTNEKLLEEPSVLYRLAATASELSPSELKFLSNLGLLPLQKKAISQKLGFIVNGKIFCTLFELFLKKSDLLPTSILNRHFTENEYVLINYLQSQKNEIVTREAIAEVIWGGDWEQKYSDWAIDQIIHRIREKLEKAKSDFEIVTKKGEGFILVEKSK